MKIAIISDIHDNIVNLKKCLNWCQKNKIDKIICSGDVTNMDTVAFLSDNFSGDIILIRGNMEIYEDDEIKGYENIKHLGRYNRFNLDNKDVGLCHEPDYINQILRIGSCDIIFYGHTHKPWIEERGKAKIVNPGTLGGVFQRASFAYWDTESGALGLKILDNL